MVQNLLGHDWDALTGGNCVVLSDLTSRVLVARYHILVACSFFDFRTMHLSSRLLCLQIEIMNGLPMTLHSSMMADHGRLTWSCIWDIGRSDLMLSSVLLEGEYELFLLGTTGHAAPWHTTTAILCIYDLLRACLMAAHSLDLLGYPWFIFHRSVDHHSCCLRLKLCMEMVVLLMLMLLRRGCATDHLRSLHLNEALTGTFLDFLINHVRWNVHLSWYLVVCCETMLMIRMLLILFWRTSDVGALLIARAHFLVMR